MTDDLAKLLREVAEATGPNMARQIALDAADRIEELEANLRWVVRERDDTFVRMLRRAEEAEAKLEKAITALVEVREFVTALAPYAEQGHSLVPALEKACTTLAELTGGKDE